MKKINRILVLIVFFSIIFLLSNVVCASSSLIEKVKGESTPIISDDGTLSKKITSLNQAANEITIQLNFKSQDSKAIKENTEIMKQKNFEIWKNVYEKFYGIPLEYTCEKNNNK